MTIEKLVENNAAVIRLGGRLDTVTAPELEKTLNECGDAIDSMTLDFSALEYVSSAGLRLILSAHKRMTAKKGTLRLVGVNAGIMEVFEITGFSDFLTIE